MIPRREGVERRRELLRDAEAERIATAIRRPEPATRGARANADAVAAVVSRILFAERRLTPPPDLAMSSLP